MHLTMAYSISSRGGGVYHSPQMPWEKEKEKVIVIGLLLLYFFDVLHNGKLTTLTK